MSSASDGSPAPGLHAAEAARRGVDYGGKGVHEAARIAGLADGGEILVSRITHAAAGDRFAASAPRSVALKGISRPVQVVAIEWR